MVATTLACLPIFWTGGVINPREGGSMLGLVRPFLLESVVPYGARARVSAAMVHSCWWWSAVFCSWWSSRPATVAPRKRLRADLCRQQAKAKAKTQDFCSPAVGSV